MTQPFAWLRIVGCAGGQGTARKRSPTSDAASGPPVAKPARVRPGHVADLDRLPRGADRAAPATFPEAGQRRSIRPSFIWAKISIHRFRTVTSAVWKRQSGLSMLAVLTVKPLARSAADLALWFAPATCMFV